MKNKAALHPGRGNLGPGHWPQGEAGDLPQASTHFFTSASAKEGNRTESKHPALSPRTPLYREEREPRDVQSPAQVTQPEWLTVRHPASADAKACLERNVLRASVTTRLRYSGASWKAASRCPSTCSFIRCVLSVLSAGHQSGQKQMEALPRQHPVWWRGSQQVCRGDSAAQSPPRGCWTQGEVTKEGCLGVVKQRQTRDG